MNKLIPLLLILLFSPFILGFSTGLNLKFTGHIFIMNQLRFVLIYAALIMLLYNLRHKTLPSGLWIYLLPSLLMLSIMLLHYLYSDASGRHTIRAEKELLRVTALVIILMVCATKTFKSIDFRILIVGFTLLGCIIGLQSIWNSFSGISSFQHHYVKGYLRAGMYIIDSNSLGAFMNTVSFFALAGLFTYKGQHNKILFFIAFILIQTGRAFTFSNGSLLNFIVSIAVATYLVWRYYRDQFRRFFSILGMLIVTMLSLTIFTRMFETFLYRVRLSDSFVYKASISSRIGQHLDYFRLIYDEPLRIFIGFGTSGLPHKLSGGLDLHNSFVRSLATGGIITFLCFMLLYYLSIRNFLIAISHSDYKDRMLPIMLLSSFIGWAFQAATLPADTSLIQWFYFIVALLLATNVKDIYRTNSIQEQSSSKPSPHIRNFKR